MRRIVTDFLLLVIPTWIIVRVQMPWGRKARLIGIFSLGVACCICSAYRSSLGNRNSKDLTCKSLHLLNCSIHTPLYLLQMSRLPYKWRDQADIARRDLRARSVMDNRRHLLCRTGRLPPCTQRPRRNRLATLSLLPLPSGQDVALIRLSKR